MDAAEDLAGQVDAVGAALAKAVEGGAVRPIDPRQAQHPRIPFQPCRIGQRARGAAARSAQSDDGRAFIDPRPAAIAIDPGGGEIAQPADTRQIRPIAHQYRINILGWRHAGQDRIGAGKRRAHPLLIGEIERSGAARRLDMPSVIGQTAGDCAGGVAQTKDQHGFHGANHNRKYWHSERLGLIRKA